MFYSARLFSTGAFYGVHHCYVAVVDGFIFGRARYVFAIRCVRREVFADALDWVLTIFTYYVQVRVFRYVFVRWRLDIQSVLVAWR